jgi:hypothetical protein
MNEEAKKQIEGMVNKAAEADKADDALKFSQAALNAAHAMQVLHTIATSK